MQAESATEALVYFFFNPMEVELYFLVNNT